MKETIEKNKKQIEELKLIQTIHEKQNYNLLMEEKHKIELDKQDMEDKYREMKKNFEDEHQKIKINRRRI